MRTRWLGFGRQREDQTALAPDNAVVGPKAWLLSAAIIASTAALLGTSDVSEPQSSTTYRFERLAIDGGFAELTADQPSATFFVTVSADDLGPDGVLSTEEAQALVRGDVTVSDLEDATLPPNLTIKLGRPEGSAQSTYSTAAHFEETQALFFNGGCENPKGGVTCAALFRLDLTRQDGGANGGIVRFDWSFDVSATGRLMSFADKEDTELGPFDPPWTVEITQQ